MSELTGLYAIWYREIKVYFREKSRLVSTIITPLMWLTIFGTGLGASIAIQNENYQTFIYPGILTMSVLFSSIFYGVYIVWDKKIDFLKEVLVAPLSRTTIFFGKVLGGTTDGLIQALIIVALGILFFSIHYTLQSFIYTMIIMFLITNGIVSIGLTIGSYMSSPEGFGLVSSFVNFPIFFLSGALFPIKNLPSWLYFFVTINPVTYGVDALRWIILGAGSVNIFIDILALMAFDIIMMFIGTYAFKKLKM